MGASSSRHKATKTSSSVEAQTTQTLEPKSGVIQKARGDPIDAMSSAGHQLEDRALHHRQCCCDPLIVTMAVFDSANSGGLPLPPLVPMVMQMVNVHALQVQLPFATPLIHAMPNWHHDGDFSNSDSDTTAKALDARFARVQFLLMTLSSRSVTPLPVGLQARVTSLRVECWPVTAEAVTSLPRLDQFALCVREGALSAETTDAIDWLSSASKLTDVTIYGSTSSQLFTDDSLRDVATLPKLTTLRLVPCALVSLKHVARATLLETLIIDSKVLTTDGIADLWQCPALRVLNLEGCSGVSDVSSLAQATSLQELHLRGRVCLHPSVAVVCRGAPALMVLSLTMVSTENAQAIAARPSLRLCLAQEVESVIDDDVLSTVLPCVERLVLWRGLMEVAWHVCRCVTDVTLAATDSLMINLSPLADIPTLTSLQLGNGLQPFNFTGSLRGSRSIKKFHCSQDDLLADASHLPYLTELTCWVKTEVTLEHVNRCRNLRVLWLCGEPVMDPYLEMINGHLFLEKVYLCYCPHVTNLSPFLRARLPSLASVEVFQTSVQDADTVAWMMRLELARRRLHTSWFLRFA